MTEQKPRERIRPQNPKNRFVKIGTHAGDFMELKPDALYGATKIEKGARVLFRSLEHGSKWEGGSVMAIGEAPQERVFIARM